MHNLLSGGKNKSHLSIKEALLPQPPSFVKKKNYEIHAKLGEGTFGKVMVSRARNPYEIGRGHDRGRRYITVCARDGMRLRREASAHIQSHGRDTAAFRM